MGKNIKFVMDFTEKETAELVKLWQQAPCLWDKCDKYFSHEDIKTATIQGIALQMVKTFKKIKREMMLCKSRLYSKFSIPEEIHSYVNVIILPINRRT